MVIGNGEWCGDQLREVRSMNTYRVNTPAGGTVKGALTPETWRRGKGIDVKVQSISSQPDSHI